MIQKIVCFMYY